MSSDAMPDEDVELSREAIEEFIQPEITSGQLRLIESQWFQLMAEEEAIIELVPQIGVRLILRLVEFNDDGEPGTEMTPRSTEDGGAEILLEFKHMKSVPDWGTVSPRSIMEIRNQVEILISYRLWQMSDYSMSVNFAVYTREMDTDDNGTES